VAPGVAATFENVPGILFSIGVEPDGDFRFLSMSDAGLAVTGLRRHQVIGALVRDVIPRASLDLVLGHYREAIRTRRTVRWEETSVYPAGSRHGEVAVTAVYDEHGAATHIVGIVHDITERKAAENMLREADARKTEFLAVLSHELRNPLAAIRYSLEVLDLAPLGSDQATRAREILDNQVTHLAHLLDDLLDVTRITRGKVELRREPLELRALLGRTVDEQAGGFETHGIAWQLSLPDTELWVDADPTRLVQVIGNLLANAMKFTPSGGRVTVSLEREGELGTLTIRDTGIGIDRDMLVDVFVPFTQARQTLDRAAGGLGLGLALVKAFVEQHGGTVTAASEGPGTGTELVVRLPLTPARPRPTTAVSPRTTAPRRVLVIEDNELAAEGLRLLLELHGHEVRVAYNGTTGVETAREFRPNVVLCDIGLPGMSGYEVARILRDDENTAHALLVALSGYTLPEDRARAAESGFLFHLAKPPNPDTLRELLDAAPAR
jgi:PAS domain S-box-containing protein